MRKILLILVLISSFPIINFGQGCASTSSTEGVQVFGYIQPQVNYAFTKDLNTGIEEDAFNFSINRARLGVMGNIPYDFSYYVLAEFSPFKKQLGVNKDLSINEKNGPYLLDAFISYTRYKWAKISLGQFKSPFGLELGQTACFDIKTVDRSSVVNDLTSPDREMGLMLSGGTDSTLFSYQLAITNGIGIISLDNNMFKAITGRIGIKPVEFLKLGVSAKYNKFVSVYNADEDTTVRFGVDLELKKGNFTFQTEYIWGKDVGTYSTGSACVGDLQYHAGSLNRWGVFAQALYMTSKNIQPVVKYEMYQTNADNSSMNQFVTVGANYFFNDWTRLQLNYIMAREETLEVRNDQVVLQIQVKF